MVQFFGNLTVMTSKIHAYGADAISLTSALTAFAKAIAKADTIIALLYTPDCCCFARLGVDGTLDLPPEPDCDPAAIFEVRAFNALAELRWLRDASTADQGAAVVITSSVVDPLAQPFKDANKHFSIIDELEGYYLLWGKGLGGNDSLTGWSRLTAAQIGTLWIPIIGVADGQAIKLNYVEHLAEGEHGNVFVLEERLTGLEKAT